MFETFRENFQDKYWLPTYTRSDDFMENEKVGELHIRMVIRDTDFKLAGRGDRLRQGMRMKGLAAGLLRIRKNLRRRRANAFDWIASVHR